MYENSFLISKISPRLLDAQQAAHYDYDRYFEVLHPYIVSAQMRIQRELHAPIGCVGYMIRVHVEAESEEVIVAALLASGLSLIVDIPIKVIQP